MAGLAGLLGGYGSDDEEDEQHDEAALSGGSPAGAAAAAAAGASPGGASPTGAPAGQQQPVRLLDGPTTNPEPPPEGLSPPLAGHAGGDGGSDGEMEEGEGANGAAAAGPLAMLPLELRAAPPGEPHKVIRVNVADFLAKQRSGVGTVMDAMRRYRTWNNPCFLERITKHFSLEQYGSNLEPGVWCPQGLPDADRWEGLKAQIAARKRARGAEVKFQSGGHQQPLASAPGGIGAAAAAAAQQHQQQHWAGHAAPQQPQHQQHYPAGLPPLPAAAVAAAAAAAAGGAGGGLASQPGAAGGAPKVVTIDPRAALAQAQAHAFAASLAGGGGPAKKSKWDK